MFEFSRFARFTAACVLSAVLSGSSIAQQFLIGPSITPAAPEAVPAPQPEPTGDKRAENAEQLRTALKKLESSASSDSAAAQEVAYHQSVEAVLAQQQAVQQQIKALETRKVELETNRMLTPESSSTFTFVELDSLKDDLASERARETLLKDKLAAAKVAVEKAERLRDEADSKARQAQDASARNKDAAQAAALTTAVQLTRQSAHLAAETLSLRKQELAREELGQKVQQLTIQLQQEKVARLSPLVVFSQADYEAQLADITKKEESAAKSLAKAQTNLQSQHVFVKTAQDELDAEAGNPIGAAERLKAQQLTAEKLTDEINSLTQRLQWLAQLRVAWNHRFQVAAANRAAFDKEAFSEFKTWEGETQQILDELARDLRMQIFRMRDLRSTLTSITKKIDAATKEDPHGILTSLELERTQVEYMLRTREKDLVAIETNRRVHEKLLEEVSSGVQVLNAKTLALGAWYEFEQIWKYELATIGDNKPLNLKIIVTALVIFVSGWMSARFVAGLFAIRVLKRFRLSKDGTAAIRSIVFYSLLALVGVQTLKFVGIPLTAFTVLGGALAIGVGFGSQNLVNNFVGGLIMLAERPVRLGERINVGRFEGVVEDVGFRCTKVRTSTDHLVTIPNSALVNESIENIARRRTIRRQINIPIEFNTSRDQIAGAVQAIRDMLEEKDIRERIHPIIGFEELRPRVFFNDFNADSLNLSIVYWYAPNDWWGYVEHSERVNFRIMEELERLGVDAFPNRNFVVKHAGDTSVEVPGAKKSLPNASRHAGAA